MVYGNDFQIYLWSIPLPGGNGVSKDQEAQVAICSNFTTLKLAHERVITKVFSHYAIPLEITDAMRSIFKAKLWRMGKARKQTMTKAADQLKGWKEQFVELRNQ